MAVAYPEERSSFAMRGPVLVVRALTLAAIAIAIAACGANDTTGDDADNGEASTEAYTGTIATLVRTPAPPGMPGSWDQPDSEGILGQNGYCGATAAANLLHFYGKEVSPRQAIDAGCWSWVGTTATDLARYFKKSFPELGCYRGRMPWDADALQNLRNALAIGKPVAVQFMTGALNAHWVTVVGVHGEGEHPELVVMTWGHFAKVKWDDFKDAWRHAWGGYYPYVMCEAVSPNAKALFIK